MESGVDNVERLVGEAINTAREAGVDREESQRMVGQALLQAAGNTASERTLGRALLESMNDETAERLVRRAVDSGDVSVSYILSSFKIVSFCARKS